MDKISIPEQDVAPIETIAPALRPHSVAPGHGRPLAGADVAAVVTELARNFDRVARPDHGLYVHNPAA